MTMEYESTRAYVENKPKPPEGEGWRLASTVGTTDATDLWPACVRHYWERPQAHEARVCKSCGAMAFHDEMCLGCGRSTL